MSDKDNKQNQDIKIIQDIKQNEDNQKKLCDENWNDSEESIRQKQGEKRLLSW